VQVVFMDESGYSFDWETSLNEQPYYVLSAVCFNSQDIPSVYNGIRNDIRNLHLENVPNLLGQGFEIKAHNIANGSGYWKKHNKERNAIRKIMLEAPRKYNGTAFVAAIDKMRHVERYIYPENPYHLALQFIFERLEHYLSRIIDDYALCIYDQNKRMEDVLQELTISLKREGSAIHKSSWSTPEIKVQIDRIYDFTFGRSENSVGLQIADFFATMTYAYLKSDKKQCWWWNTLEASLCHKDNKLEGIGYKEFP